jgi:hypothetical protein
MDKENPDYLKLYQAYYYFRSLQIEEAKDILDEMYQVYGSQ